MNPSNSGFTLVIFLLTILALVIDRENCAAQMPSEGPAQDQRARSVPKFELLPDDHPPVTVKGYENHELCGWHVLISDQLKKNAPKQLEIAVQLAGKQLRQIESLVPGKPLEALKRVPIWFSPEYPNTRPGAEYHPSRSWLRNHGRRPEMAKCIELTNIRIFERECKRMPMLMLHELAHGYHDQVLGFDHPEIVAAFEAAESAGLYQSVERSNGKMERAYALTNHKEYFAELTECYFGTNDFFPFVRQQLKRYDARMERLLGKLWQVE